MHYWRPNVRTSDSVSIHVHHTLARFLDSNRSHVDTYEALRVHSTQIRHKYATALQKSHVPGISTGKNMSDSFPSGRTTSVSHAPGHRTMFDTGRKNGTSIPDTIPTADAAPPKRIATRIERRE